MLGQDYDVPRFRTAVMSRISKTMLGRPTDPSWLPTLDDLRYVEQRASAPDVPCLRHLKTATHVGVISAVSLGLEEGEQWSEVMRDESVMRSMYHTFLWFCLEDREQAKLMGIVFVPRAKSGQQAEAKRGRKKKARQGGKEVLEVFLSGWKDRTDAKKEARALALETGEQQPGESFEEVE